MSLSGSPTTLVFPLQTEWQYSDVDPPNGDVECKGVWINHDFRTISRFISEMMQDIKFGGLILESTQDMTTIGYFAFPTKPV